MNCVVISTVVWGPFSDIAQKSLCHLEILVFQIISIVLVTTVDLVLSKLIELGAINDIYVFILFSLFQKWPVLNIIKCQKKLINKTRRGKKFCINGLQSPRILIKLVLSGCFVYRSYWIKGYL